MNGLRRRWCGLENGKRKVEKIVVKFKGGVNQSMPRIYCVHNFINIYSMQVI